MEDERDWIKDASEKREVGFEGITQQKRNAVSYWKLGQVPGPGMKAMAEKL